MAQSLNLCNTEIQMKLAGFNNLSSKGRKNE